MSQTKYLQGVLNRFGMNICNPKAVPCDLSFNKSNTDSNRLPNNRLYREIISSLIHAICGQKKLVTLFSDAISVWAFLSSTPASWYLLWVPVLYPRHLFVLSLLHVSYIVPRQNSFLQDGLDSWNEALTHSQIEVLHAMPRRTLSLSDAGKMVKTTHAPLPPLNSSSGLLRLLHNDLCQT